MNSTYLGTEIKWRDSNAGLKKKLKIQHVSLGRTCGLEGRRAYVLRWIAIGRRGGGGRRRRVHSLSYELDFIWERRKEKRHPSTTDTTSLLLQTEKEAQFIGLEVKTLVGLVFVCERERKEKEDGGKTILLEKTSVWLLREWAAGSLCVSVRIRELPFFTKWHLLVLILY